MKKQDQPILSEDEFRKRLHDLLGGSPVCLTLQHSDGKDLHTLFSIGSGHGQPAGIVERVGGYYLVGEGVQPELLGPIHNLFALYCRSHIPVSPNPINMHYQSFPAQHRHQLRLHFPIKMGEFHQPVK